MKTIVLPSMLTSSPQTGVWGSIKGQLASLTPGEGDTITKINAKILTQDATFFLDKKNRINFSPATNDPSFQPKTSWKHTVYPIAVQTLASALILVCIKPCLAQLVCGHNQRRNYNQSCSASHYNLNLIFTHPSIDEMSLPLSTSATITIEQLTVHWVRVRVGSILLHRLPLHWESGKHEVIPTVYDTHWLKVISYSVICVWRLQFTDFSQTFYWKPVNILPKAATTNNIYSSYLSTYFVARWSTVRST